MLKELTQLVNRWRHKQDTMAGTIGAYWYESGLALAYLRLENGQPEVLATQHILCASNEEKQAALTNFLNEHKLLRASLCLSLSPNEYKITLLDSPNVPEKDLHAAVRWLVRDVINYPLEEAAVDVFPVPLPRARDNVNMLYVINVPIPRILQIEQVIENNGLKLELLTIPEIAIQTALNLNANAKEGALVVFLMGQQGKLLLLQGGFIHLIRNFELSDDTFESLSTEIQRYLDYANSLFRRNLCKHIILMQKSDIPDLETSLKSSLDVSVETLSLTTLFPGIEVSSVTAAIPLFIAIGTAMNWLLDGQPSFENAS